MKKVLAAVLAFVMVLSMLPAGIITSSALTSGDYTYTVTDSKATITAFSGTAANVTIPGTLGGYPVTEIGEIAFSNKDTLVSVVFPECLSSIGDSAFSYCDALTQVSIPNSVVSIGVDAFNWCTVLSSVSIGRGLAALGNDAFTDCTILTQIVVDGQNLNFSTRDGVLFNKNQTTLICCPHGITGAYNIPDGVKIISEDAFFHCKKLTSVFFPDSLTSIGIRAFYGCEGITSITLGNELTAIGLYAFTYCYKLISAYFLSNAPTSEAGVFSSCASGFTTYHLSDKTGFTSPPWNVYPTAVFTQPGQYTITFNANGGTGGTSALMTSGKALTVPAVSKAGYVFNGWSPAVPVSVPEADTTYVAQWRETNPAITFNSNGGSEAAAITQAYNTPVEKPADPLKDGVTFGGWYMDPALTTPVVWPFTVTQSTVFYAKWNAENCYTIIFNANSGTGGTSVVMPAGDPLTAPAVARTGYTLAGWAPAVPVTVPAANTTYTAQWTANTYSVNYNGNGNITGSTASSTHTYDVSANLTANGFIKTGNSFLGWSTNQSPTSAAYTNGQNVLNLTLNQGEVITLYAVWSANQYTITFSANGGTGGTSSSMLYGAALTAPTVTRMNYSFSSWSPAVPATVPAANTTYTAQWTGIQFAVTFDAQGGTVSPVTSTVTYAKTYGAGTGGFPTPTKTGYTFGGWYTGTGGTGTKILSTTTATTTAPQTLYAKWTAFTYTVVYNGNGSTGGSMSSTSHTYNTAKALRANGFTYTGYAFIGWATSAGGDVVYSDGQSVINLTETSGATITLYAKWNDVNAHVITFDANGGTGGKSTTLIAGSPL
ncbi:MAG: InlB B-repeat-containing protein, partial [Eubacteriales bacterium]